MATVSDTVLVKIKADSAHAIQGFKQVGDKVSAVGKHIGDTFKKVGKVVAVGLAAGAAGILLLAKGAIDQARDAQRVARLTEAVIKSTGGAANVSVAQIGQLASKLSVMSGVEDDLIKNSENVLLTFTAVRNEAGKGNDIFNQATLAILNVSSALGQDLQKTTIQVGKALNDPIKGMAALRRIGVSFTTSQVDQVKAMVKTGHTMDAQKLILRELNTEFGGAAKAAADPWKKLDAAWKNVQETFGGLLLRVLNPVLSWLADKMPAAIDTLIDWFGKIKLGLETGFQNPFKKIAKDAPAWVQVTVRIGQGLRKIYDWLATNIPKAVHIFTTVITGAFKGGQKLVADLARAFHTSQGTILKVIAAIGLGLIGLAVAWNLGPGAIVTGIVILVAFFLYLYNRFEFVRIGVQGGFVVMSKYAQIHLAIIRGAIDLTSNVIVGFLGVTQIFAAQWDEAWSTVASVVTSVWGAIEPPLSAIKAMLSSVVGLVDRLSGAGGAATGAVGTIRDLAHSLGIPGFAAGGRVPGAIGAPMLAVVHGGEFVVSNAMQRGGGGGAHVTQHITVVNNDPRAVVDAINAAARNGIKMSRQAVPA